MKVLKVVVDEMPESRWHCRFYNKDAPFEHWRCKVGKNGSDYCTFDSSGTCTHLVLDKSGGSE